MTRNPEGHRQWSSDLCQSDEDDDILSIDAVERYAGGVDTPGDAFAGEFADELDSFEEEVDTIADELSRLGFHSAADFN